MDAPESRLKLRHRAAAAVADAARQPWQLLAVCCQTAAEHRHPDRSGGTSRPLDLFGTHRR